MGTADDRGVALFVSTESLEPQARPADPKDTSWPCSVTDGSCFCICSGGMG